MSESAPGEPAPDETGTIAREIDMIVLERVDSTMAEAARRAPELDRPTWIMAYEQTAAKGRRGRAWQQGRGDFSATLVMRAAPREAALRSFSAALALCDCLAALGFKDLALKWPNDVLLSGKKAAGILLEMLPGERLAIGIGVNLVSAPEADRLEEGALEAARLDAPVAPRAFLELIAPAFEAWETRFLREGFAPLRTAWLARAAKLGEPIRARTV
ncbi:MAG: biotin--[acetyl-CoA-carboxylase] ligase, partial [Pseudomonadota bacterium]